MVDVRGRLAPLAVRPFGRLLSSYTLNELGDSVGIVALAVLVYDRTQAVAPTTAFFFVAKFLPALLAPLLTARIDQMALRRSLPTLYVVEAAAFAALALIAHGDFVLVLVLVLGLIDGTLALTGRALTRGAVGAVLQPTGLLREGNALLNVGFAVSAVGGTALGGLLIAEVGVSTALLVDAASFLAIATLLALTRGLPVVRVEQEAWRVRLGGGPALRGEPADRAPAPGRSGACPCAVHADHADRGDLREGEPRDDERGLRHPAGLVGRWDRGGQPDLPGRQAAFSAARDRSSTAAIGIAYLGMASAQTLLVACLVSVLGGAGNGVQWISVMTAVQEATRRRLSGAGRGTARVARRGDARRRLHRRRRAGGSRIAAYRVRRRRRGSARPRRHVALLRPQLDRPAASRPPRGGTRPGDIPLPDSLRPAAPSLEATVRSER